MIKTISTSLDHLFEFCEHGGGVSWVEPWAVLEVQHGQNQEHRRRFTMRLILESDGKAVRDWFDELHALEGAE